LKKQFACLVQGFPLGPGWLAAVAAALAGCGCWEDPGATAAGCPAGYLPPASGRLPAGWLAAAVGLGVSLLAAGWLAVGSVGWLAAGCPAGYLPPASGRLPAGWLLRLVWGSAYWLLAGWRLGRLAGWLLRLVWGSAYWLLAGWRLGRLAGWAGWSGCWRLGRLAGRAGWPGLAGERAEAPWAALCE